MFERDMPEKELERLSRAITEAIFNSKDVKKILEEIREKDLVIPSTLLVMLLKLDALSSISDSLNSHQDLLNEVVNKKKINQKKHLIDGKELRPNDIAFQEYLIKKFNEKEWLKKNGLVF